jgi:predicted dehydrogenase
LTTQPIRIGVLGTARIARGVIPQIHASQSATAVAVGSRSVDKAQQFASELKIPEYFGSYDEVLESPSVDAVYIPLPPALHEAWTLKAAAAGKHVLCEKPLAVNAAQSRHMIETCVAANVVLLDCTMWYHTERARAIKQLVTRGQLGLVRQITTAFTFPGDALAAENLRLSSALGGGSLLDIGWYCVGASLWMLEHLPERVFATAQWRNGIDWRLNGLMWFSNGQMASIECGFDAIRRRWMEIAGTTAAVVCDDFTRPWNVEKPRFWIHDNQGTSHPHVIPHPPIERCLVDAFCDLIRSQNVRHQWLPLSLQTQSVCDALLKSAAHETIEHLPTE